jgi:transcriptional regulator of acetoin/glycerol metabolism
LARSFAARLIHDPDRILTEGVMAALASYAWPGNVRELRNAVERLAAVGELDTRVRQARGPALYEEARRDAIARFEAEYCRSLLAAHGGVVARAAEAAGLSRQMLHRLLKRHGIA